MSKVTIPQGYHAPLSVYELQRAIEFIKSNFQTNLSNALNLRRVSAPLFVEEASGLNDNLNGYERPVSFDIPDVGAEAQVVHSLAKWKRLALKRYQFNVGKGLFTDMNAIRRDEEVDNLHSVYVDQWDWEKVIAREDRTVDYLKRTVRDIVGAVCETNDALGVAFPSLHTKLSLTMGGGIGQSRVCMLMIGTCHIGEVQSSIWDKATIDACRSAGILLL